MKKLTNKFAILTFGLFIVLIFNQANFGQKSGTNSPAQNSKLNGKIWQLTQINGEAVSIDRTTIQFNFDKKRVGGNGGCNGFGGTLKASGKQIKISEIISTKMFCENDSDVENKYLSTLETATKFRVADGKLQLLKNKKIVLEFAPKN